MGSIIGGLLSLLGNGIVSFFNFKGDQARTVQSTIDFLKSINDMDGQVIQAHAQAVAALMTGGSLLERIWRPTFMVILMGIICSYWFFGFVPAHFNEPMSPMMVQVFDLLKIGLMGYIPGRTAEKIVSQIQLGAVLRELINKKLA